MRVISFYFYSVVIFLTFSFDFAFIAEKYKITNSDQTIKLIGYFPIQYAQVNRKTLSILNCIRAGNNMIKSEAAHNTESIPVNVCIENKVVANQLILVASLGTFIHFYGTRNANADEGKVEIPAGVSDLKSPLSSNPQVSMNSSTETFISGLISGAVSRARYLTCLLNSYSLIKTVNVTCV